MCPSCTTGDPNSNVTGRMRLHRYNPGLSWAGSHRGASSAAAGDLCNMFFVALQGQQRFASSPLGFRFHPHLREPSLPTLRHHPSQSPPIAQTLTNNSAEISHHQTRAKMLCSTSSCCGFCCGNQFGLEPSSDDSWHSAAPAAPEGHCQLYHPCDKANTPRIHRAATSSIGSLRQQLTLGGKDAKKVKAV